MNCLSMVQSNPWLQVVSTMGTTWGGGKGGGKGGQSADNSRLGHHTHTHTHTHTNITQPKQEIRTSQYSTGKVEPLLFLDFWNLKPGVSDETPKLSYSLFSGSRFDEPLRLSKTLRILTLTVGQWRATFFGPAISAFRSWYFYEELRRIFLVVRLWTKTGFIVVKERNLKLIRSQSDTPKKVASVNRS